MARSPEDSQFGIAGEYLNIPVCSLGRMYPHQVACGRKASVNVSAVSLFGRAGGETPPPFDKKSKTGFREGVRTLEDILAVLGKESTIDYMRLISHYIKSRTVSGEEFFQLSQLVMDRVVKERKTFKEIAELDEAARITSCPRGSFRLRNSMERTFYFWLNSFYYLVPEVPLRVPLRFQDSYIYRLGATRAENAFNRVTTALFMADMLSNSDNYQLLIESGIDSLRIMTWISCLLAREEEFFEKIGYSPTLADRREIRNFRRLISVLPRSVLSALTERISLARLKSGKTNFFKCAFGSADKTIRSAAKQVGQDSLFQFMVKAKKGINSRFISASDEKILASIAVKSKCEGFLLHPLDAIRVVWAMVAFKKPFYTPDVRDVLKSMDGGIKTFEDFITSTCRERIQEEARRSYQVSQGINPDSAGKLDDII